MLDISILFMREELRKLLITAGLSEVEASVYVSVLKTPAETKWEVVRRTKAEKNRVYRACEKLESLYLLNRTKNGIYALTLEGLIKTLKKKQDQTTALIKNLIQHNRLVRIPEGEIDKFQIAVTQDEIIDQHIRMSGRKYNTCLDFGDFEGFVPILGGINHAFQFRANRFKRDARSMTICTTEGPFTGCMSRESDMKRFKSKAWTLKTGNKNQWIIFSDTLDYLMINDFADEENPTAITIKSKSLADAQRKKFYEHYKNIVRSAKYAEAIVKNSKPPQ